ncbi:MAG: TIGR04551 family protein [Pseudomonadota bacterium]
MLAAPLAHGQYGMGGMGQPGGMPNAPMGQQPKDEGPAQQAPEEPGQPSDLEPLGGYTDQNRRRAQMFEVDGYFRLRTDYMHNFNLGQGYSSAPRFEPSTPGSVGGQRAGLPPFPTPLSCPVPTGSELGDSRTCGDKDISTASIRLRLEPTINVTDQVRVRSQIDVLDNTILGSTPDSLAGLDRPYGAYAPQAPIPYLYTSQDPPEIGQNGYLSSIRAKRAWAEVDTEFGSLRFGRMPWHFGRGMSFNDGSCLDCTGGTTVDRIALLTEVYGHQLTLALDYGSQGLTTNQLALGRYSPDGYPIDVAQDDDVFQYMFAVTKIDNPVQLRERVDRGDAVLNYGLQLVYRTQQSTYDDAGCVPTVGVPTPAVPAEMCVAGPQTKEQAPRLHNINAMLFQPNIWLKLYYRALTVEFEGTGVLGKMDDGGILLAQDQLDRKTTFRQWGGVLASELHLYRDSFFVGFETGAASGDQAEDRSQYLNYRWRFVRQPRGDTSIRDFKFSPDYHVDSILFRHILGTVTNAVYFKPALSYWFDLQQSRQLGLSGSFVYSLAQVPVATPGNELGYGLEMNVSASYRNTAEGFYAGMTWGVLWPFGALDRPGTSAVGEAPWAVTDNADAKAAQVLRGFLGVKF